MGGGTFRKVMDSAPHCDTTSVSLVSRTCHPALSVTPPRFTPLIFTPARRRPEGQGAPGRLAIVARGGGVFGARFDCRVISVRNGATIGTYSLVGDAFSIRSCGVITLQSRLDRAVYPCTNLVPS